MAYLLAQSVDDVKNYLTDRVPGQDVGLDTEGTSLDTRRSLLVGHSLSIVEGTAIYVPLAHKIGTNVPWQPVIELIKQLEEEGTTFVFYNTKYDANHLQRNTRWAPKRHLDALELVYLDNPDRMKKGLKEVARTELGVDMEKFEDLFSEEERKAKVYDISTKSPQRCTNYAAADADMALRVAKLYDKVRKEQEFAVKVDTKLVDVVRRIEHNGGMVLNEEYITRTLAVLKEREIALRQQAWRMAGVEFDIESPKQLGNVLFERMGIPSQGQTRGVNPIHKTDAETLEKLAKAHPIIEIVITYKKVSKAAGTYFKKLEKLMALKVPVRFQFNMYAAPTFRFAAPGGDPLVDGACGVNIQAVSNGEARDLFAVDLEPKEAGTNYKEELSDDDLLIEVGGKEAEAANSAPYEKEALIKLPWVVEEENDLRLMCFRETCGGCPANCKGRGVDLTRRVEKGLMVVPSVRQAFMAPPGWTLASFDYDRQELVIGANMSGEPRWLKALASGEDLHVLTAAAAYGVSPEAFRAFPKGEYSRKRGVGKVLNFATFYGATAYTLSKKADMPLSQAELVYEGFVKNHPTLFSWMSRVKVFARKEGYTTTYFGRKRSLRQFYESPDRKMHAFADRSAVNTAIQGTAAEVTRIAMVKAAAELERNQLGSDRVKFVMQVHDELVFLIKDEFLIKACRVIKDAMELKVKSWQVQLSVGPKLGRIWGKQVEMSIEKIEAGMYKEAA
jgi:DNA polymerase I-like protein with 3'-5' exonuclease and polymerase domains